MESLLYLPGLLLSTWVRHCQLLFLFLRDLVLEPDEILFQFLVALWQFQTCQIGVEFSFTGFLGLIVVFEIALNLFLACHLEQYLLQIFLREPLRVLFLQMHLNNLSSSPSITEIELLAQTKPSFLLDNICISLVQFELIELFAEIEDCFQLIFIPVIDDLLDRGLVVDF